MKSTTSSHFSQVPRATINRSQFDCSHGYKTTFDAGLLIPVFASEALPGDTFNLSMTAFARLATPLKPTMDNMFLESFFFFVPNRLIWDNWQRFNGEQDNPDDSTDYLVPQTNAPQQGFPSGSLADYMGLPINVGNISVNALHFRAYRLIWNDFFRDENLQDSQNVQKDDGPDIAAGQLLRRGKRHDYFTSGLPWAQKGEPVSVPLGGNAPITGLGATAQAYNGSNGTVYETGAGASRTYDSYASVSVESSPTLLFMEEDANNPGYPNMYANLSEATAVTINELREAFQIQKLYERDARGGTRYTEIIKSHFGVTSPDSRLQRPEYLGGGSTPVNITQVAQTSSTSDSQGPVDTPQGNLAGYGTVSASNHGFTKSFTEHGVLLGMVCVRADLTYQQGIKRMWSRQTRWDFYWPALSHLGEQGTLNKEIFAQGNDEDDEIFCYQERYAEYRYHPSMITGKFRSQAEDTLDVWHLAQDFENLPTLNSDFIEEHPPIDRIIAVQDEPHFLFDSYFKLICARPMPIYAVPGLIDHF